jgi:hypothetical protein
LQRSFFPAPAVYPNIVEARAGNQFERDVSDLKAFLPNLGDFFPRGKSGTARLSEPAIRQSKRDICLGQACSPPPDRPTAAAGRLLVSWWTPIVNSVQRLRAACFSGLSPISFISILGQSVTRPEFCA